MKFRIEMVLEVEEVEVTPEIITALIAQVMPVDTVLEYDIPDSDEVGVLVITSISGITVGVGGD